MEALLIDEWLRASPDGGRDAIPIVDLASISLVRERVRALGATMSTAPGVVDRACLVASEIGTNHVRHTYGGTILVAPAVRDGHRGIEVIGLDRGPGLADIAAAIDAPLREGAGSLGVGVGSIRRLSTDVDIDVRVGEGTRIAARVFEPEVPRRREVGIYGRPLPGESANGDHASFRRFGGWLVVGVCDGLGHGPAAREAASAAVAAFDTAYGGLGAPPPVVDAFASIHAALASTRGAVMAIATIDEDASAFTTGSVGNIDVQVCRPRAVRRFGGLSAVLGGRPPARNTRVRPETTPIARDEVVVVTTDGITSKMAIETDLELLRMHPAVIAQRIVERFARTNDDALVLVVR